MRYRVLLNTQLLRRFFGICIISLLGTLSTTLHAYSLELQWNAPSNQITAGYKLYYGTASRQYTNVSNAGTNLSYTVSNLVAGVPYYFAATDYDAQLQESDFSNEATWIGDGVLTLFIQPPALGSSTNPITLQFPENPGKTYTVQASADLITWTNIAVDIAPTNRFWSFQEASVYERRFYRLSIETNAVVQAQTVRTNYLGIQRFAPQRPAPALL